MANGIRTGDPRRFNKERSSKFRGGSRVRQTSEEGRRTYRPKRYGNNNKDEDNSPKTLNDIKVQMEFELTYFKATAQHLVHYTTTLHGRCAYKNIKKINGENIRKLNDNKVSTVL